MSVFVNTGHYAAGKNMNFVRFRKTVRGSDQFAADWARGVEIMTSVSRKR